MVDSLRQLLRKSEKEILKIWSAPGIVFHSEEGLLEEFRKAAERGVKIKGLVEINDENIEDVRYLSQFANLRSAKGIFLRHYGIRLQIQPKFWLTRPNPHWNKLGVTAFWTDNLAIVNGFIEDFTRKWEASHPIKFDD